VTLTWDEYLIVDVLDGRRRENGGLRIGMDLGRGNVRFWCHVLRIASNSGGLIVLVAVPLGFANSFRYSVDTSPLTAFPRLHGQGHSRRSLSRLMLIRRCEDATIGNTSYDGRERWHFSALCRRPRVSPLVPESYFTISHRSRSCYLLVLTAGEMPRRKGQQLREKTGLHDWSRSLL
jgi:hypothetical protein